MRYRIRTLMIILTLGPPLLAFLVFLIVHVRYWSNYNSARDDNGQPPTFHQPSP